MEAGGRLNPPPIAPWIENFLSVCWTLKREKQLEIYRRDSLLMQEGRAVERERMAAVAGHEHYEGGCDGDE
jgi:hypothetical protein